MEHNDALLTRSFELAAEARAAGDHPFGALFEVDGEILAEARNRVNTDRDITAHAETALVRMLEQERLLNQIGSGTLYTSCEPCPMCVGAMFWIGVRRVVFGLSSPRLTELATPIHFDGPHREDEAASPHLGFWAP